MQQAFAANPGARTIRELDGRDVRGTEHNVTETLIRGMHGCGRQVMGL